MAPEKQSSPEYPIKPDHVLGISTEFFEIILKKTKTIEVRLKTPEIDNYKVGDTLQLECGNRKALVKIVSKKEYATVNELLDNEDPNKIVPGMDKEQIMLLALAKQYEKDSRLKVAIEIELIENK